MVKPNFILDFETLGKDPTNCAVVECSYTIFDWDRFDSKNAYTYNELLESVQYAKFKIEDQISNHNLLIDKSTLEWWQSQSLEVRSILKPSSQDILVKEFIENVITFIGETKLKYWWSRSNTFDPIILWNLSHKTSFKNKISEILPHYLVRDTRSFIDAKTDFSLNSNGFCPLKDEALWKKLFVKHSSKHDIVADILRLQTITRVEKDLQTPE